MAHTVLGVLVLAGLWRLCTIRTTDRWPEPDRADSPEMSSSIWERFAVVCLHVTLVVMFLPLFHYPQGLPIGDWDLGCQWHEAIRKTIVDYGQFPWWNPWVRGGFPLAGEPQVALVALPTPFVLIWGTSIGMRLAVVAHTLLAAEGARRLCLLWTRQAWPAALAGLIYAANGCMLLYASCGPQIPLSNTFLPWMLYFCFRLDRRFSDAIGLGGAIALSILGVIQYMTAYALIATAAVWIRGFRLSWKGSLWRWLVHSLAAAGTVLLLAGWKLSVAGHVLRDFPRELQSLWDVSVLELFENMLRRPINVPLDVPTVECCFYVGPVVLILTFLSIRHGWRWWHWLIVLPCLLSLGAYRWYHPSYWLASWPGFATMHVVTRWRMVAVLGMAMAAADVLSRQTQLARRAWLLGIGTVLLVADYGHFAHAVLPRTFSLPAIEKMFPGPAVGSTGDASQQPIVNVERWELPPGAVGGFDQSLGFPCTLRGYGVIRGNEPQMGYEKGGPTARLWRGHADYIAEHWTSAGSVIPEEWSPNRILLQVEPNQQVQNNQNPGSWWLVNGQRKFASLRCSEWEQAFAVTADERGIVELRVWPPGLELACGVTALGAILLGCSLWFRRQWTKPRVIQTGGCG